MNDNLNNDGSTNNLDGTSFAPTTLGKRPRKQRSDAGKKRTKKALIVRRANRKTTDRKPANRTDAPKRNDKKRSSAIPQKKGKKTGHTPWNAGKKLHYKVWNAGKKTGIEPWNKGKKINKKTGLFE